MKDNQEILKERITAFNAVTGRPRVGDYIYTPQTDSRIPEYTRITHDWNDRVQTGGNSGSSYYLGDGYLSYSGGLDSGIATDCLILTDDVKPGSVWFFDGDIAGAGRGVYFQADMRVYRVKEGSDISGLWHLHCPYRVTVITEEHHKRTCNYWYLVTKNAISETAFTTKAELMEWLSENRLTLTEELTEPGTYSDQRLSYV